MNQLMYNADLNPKSHKDKKAEVWESKILYPSVWQ